MMLLIFQERVILEKRVVKFCAERELCVGNTYFEHKSLHKSTSVGRSQDGVDVKNMIDLRDLREH